MSFIDKLDRELDAFRKSYDKFESIQIYNDWHIIGFYESVYDVLADKFGINLLGDDYIDDSIIDWLDTKDAPIAFLYEEYENYGDFSLAYGCLPIKNWLEDLYNERGPKGKGLDNVIEKSAKQKSEVLNERKNIDLGER